MTTAEKCLEELYVQYKSTLPVEFQWEDEKDRLDELMFCLLLKTIDAPETGVRLIVSSLSNLNLLDVPQLAETSSEDIEKTGSLPQAILSILLRNGIERKSAKRGVLALCELSKGLVEHFHGKPQIFLRKHGENMVRELLGTIKLSAVAEDDRRRIFVHWLQNVLEMPIPLSTEYLADYCKDCNTRFEQLIDAADAKDLNVAVLDDLAKMKYSGTL